MDALAACMSVPGVSGGQKRVSYHLTVELQIDGEPLCGSWESNPDRKSVV